MRPTTILFATVAIAATLGAPAAAAIKKVAYPEVNVVIDDAYKPDAAFETMRKALASAMAKKDSAALFALVAPIFVWMVDGRPADEFDMGRDALHNFKVVLGFRTAGADADGDVKDGPYWESLAALADDATFYRVSKDGNLVCGPIAASVKDENVLDQATKKLENGDDSPEWYFTLADTAVAKAPGDAGTPIAKVGQVALPVLSVYPAAKEGQPAYRPTHLEVLLTSGKSGWIPASAARPLSSDRLCYAKTLQGDWKIAAYDQLSEQ
jgi:ketosteroid isomerase-like protein